MGTNGKMIELQSATCLCGSLLSADILFSAESKFVCKCPSCCQVYVVGIDEIDTHAKYDGSEYFTQRNKYLEKQEELTANFQKIMDKICLYKSGGTLLDVGCSVGILLETARRRNFEVKGVELSRWASEFARQRGFDVVTGGLAEAAYSDSSFDVVIMNHVLEHIPDPVAIMHEVKRILKNDGLFVVGVPNFGSPMAKLMKERWFSLLPDQHIWQFTHSSLDNLLRSTGFAVFFFEARENHQIVGWRPIKVLQRLVNLYAVRTNNAEAMLVLARKAKND